MRPLSRSAWLLVATTLFLGGCGSAASVQGDVTYEGTPVEKGTITFLPSDGKGPSAGGAITNGKYNVPDVPPGPKLVKIEATKAVPFARSSEEMAKMAAEQKAKGNKTGLIDPADVIPANAVGNNAAVEIARGKQTKDFHLTKPAAKGR